MHHVERTPLMIAVGGGHENLISYLIKEKGADVNGRTNDGSTGLMIASSKGHTSIAAMLIACNAQVNLTTRNGCTALMLAALAGHEDIVKLLLCHGADSCAKTVDGSTAVSCPLHLALCQSFFPGLSY